MEFQSICSLCAKWMQSMLELQLISHLYHFRNISFRLCEQY